MEVEEEIENQLQQLRYYILTYQQEKKESEYLSKLKQNPENSKQEENKNQE
jgi:hypothetical protein